MDVATAAETALYAASFIWVLNLLGGLLVCWLYDRWNGIQAALPVVLVMSGLQGGLTLVLSQWNDTLNGFIASSVAFVSIFLLGRMRRYREAKPATSHIFTEERRRFEVTPETSGNRAAGDMSLHQAFIP